MITRVAAWPSAWLALAVAIVLASVRVVEHPQCPAPAPERGRCVGVGVLEDSLCAISNELDDVNDRIAQAVSAVADARNEAELVAARVQLALLQHEQYELKQRARTFQEAVAKANRTVHRHISAACLANPLAEGCN